MSSCLKKEEICCKKQKKKNRKICQIMSYHICIISVHFQWIRRDLTSKFDAMIYEKYIIKSRVCLLRTQKLLRNTVVTQK